MANPTTVSVFDIISDGTGTPMPNVTVTCSFDYNASTSTTPVTLITPNKQSTTTSATGRFAFNVIPNDLISPANTVYTITTPFRSYQIAPQSTGGASQQSTAVGVIVNTPGVLTPATQNVTGPLAVAGAFTASTTSHLVGDATFDANAIFHGPDPWFDVKWFGAKGDDATDDTAAIVLAVAAAAATGTLIGGVVYFPVGTYRHTGFTLPTYVSLKGAGMNSSILKYTGSGIAVQPSGAADWSFASIEDLQFSATASPANYCFSNHNITRDYTIRRVRINGYLGGFDLWQSINFRAEEVYVQGQGGLVAGGIGWRFGNSGTGAASTTTTLEDCYITDVETCVYNSLCQGLKLDRCVFEVYKTGVNSFAKTILIYPWFEAGVAGKLPLHSEDAMSVWGGSFDAVTPWVTFAGSGASRYTELGGFPFGGLILSDKLQIPPSAGGTLAPSNYGSVPVKIDEKSGVSASYDFQNIPSGFRSIQLRCQLRDNGAGTGANYTSIRMNNISTSTYDSEQLIVSGTTTAVPIEQLAATSANVGYAIGGGAAAGEFAKGTIDIEGYADAVSTKLAHGRWSMTTGTNATGSIYQTYFTAKARALTAITRLTLLSGSGSYDANSWAELWGYP